MMHNAIGTLYIRGFIIGIKWMGKYLDASRKDRRIEYFIAHTQLRLYPQIAITYMSSVGMMR